MLILLTMQDNKQYGKSPYLSSTKTKTNALFPRIQKPAPPCTPKFLAKSPGPATAAIPGEKPLLTLEQIRNSKQCRELERMIHCLEYAHTKEMAEIEKKKQQIQHRLKTGNKQNYKAKYALWELRNEIIELEAALQEGEDEYLALVQDLGLHQDPDYEGPDYEDPDYEHLEHEDHDYQDPDYQEGADSSHIA